MGFRNALVLCVLIAAAVGTWYARLPDEPAPAAAPPEGARPGYYLRDAVILRTAEDGRVLYRVRAELAEQRTEDRALLLDGVSVEYLSAEQIPWRVRAARAAALAEESSLELEGDVELVRDPLGERPAAVVRADRLLLLPEHHFASASGPVSISVGSSTLSASSLKAFLKEDRLELESDVHGRFHP